MATAPDPAAIGEKTIRLPWGAWHGDGEHVLDVPSEWIVEELPMAGARSLSRAEIEAGLDAPIGTPPLHVVAAGRRTAAIAIDDATRPTRTAQLLEPVVDRLSRAGVGIEDITILVASGAHRLATRRDLELKIGTALLGRVRVVSHSPAGDLVDTGATLSGVPVRVNRAFADADVRIGIGAVLPHPFAAFSGGGKIVIPGLCDLDVLVRTHKFALMGFRGGPDVDRNRFRTEMERAVRQIGLDWTVNVVVNSTRQAACVRAGDFVEAHRSAAAAALRIAATQPPVAPLDALILNAYPKDGEMLQIEAAFVALRSGMLEWLAPGAPIVLTAACPEGLGDHALFGPGGRLARTPASKTFLGAHGLWVFSPNVDEERARTVFWNGYPFMTSWDALVARLRDVLPQRARVGVVPCGALQLVAPGQPPDGPSPGDSPSSGASLS